MTLVTVLLAVRNGGSYLAEAIDSVLAQTYTDFELLIVDDASTDASAELAEQYGDGRIRVVRNAQNLGQIPSLNRGLQAARGDYVARLDHDDICLPHRLERQTEILDAHSEVALVSTWVDVIDPDGRLWTRLRPRVSSYADFLARIVIDDLPFAHPALMFRRDVVLGLGGFDERLGAAEDKDLYRRLALARHEAHVVPQTLVVYRRHEGQMTYTNAAMVNRNDEASHDRFLATLAPEMPAQPVRMLFWGDERFWHQPVLQAGALENFLQGVIARQRLEAGERERFARALGDRAARSLALGWCAGSRGYGDRARPVAAFAARYGGSAARASLALQPLLRTSAPAGRRVASARHGLRRTLRSRPLERLRHVARRSRALRAVYTKLLGFDLLDD